MKSMLKATGYILAKSPNLKSQFYRLELNSAKKYLLVIYRVIHRISELGNSKIVDKNILYVAYLFLSEILIIRELQLWV
jgi:hypothetical protein